MEDAHVKIEELIEKAKTEAKQIVDQAEKEKDVLYKQAFQEGKQDGYQQGMIDLQVEHDKKMNDFQLEIKRVQDEYEEKKNQLEPLLVDTLLKLLDEVLEVQISDKRKIILALLKKSLLQIENSNEFKVFLNRNQMDYLNENFESFQAEIGREKKVDCFLDDSLKIGRASCRERV